jgi:flagellar biosynthesis protein FlhG
MFMTMSEREATTSAGVRARVIAVASGKGGVGKTWISITMAHAIARRHCAVLLVDCDLGLANIDIQLGLMPKADIGSVLSGAMQIEQALIRHAGGFDILSGCSGSGELASLGDAYVARLQQLIASVAPRYDVILLDLGAGLDRFVRELSCWADMLLVVATDEPTSLTDAYAVLKLYQQDRSRHRPNARIAVNQAASAQSGLRTYATLTKATQSFLGFTPLLAGVVRRDDKVQDAIRRQTLLIERHPSSTSAQDVAGIIDRLL